LPSEMAQALQPSKPGHGALGWLVRRLAGSDAGRIEIETPSGARWVHQGEKPGPDARIIVRRWSALRRLITGGDIGFAESYRVGDWWTPDLVAFFTWVTVNEAALTMAWRGSSSARLFDRLRHAGRANTRSGSRRNISAHYDLGNNFYAAWLDSGINYSSALYLRGDETLEAAQLNKLDRVIGHLRLPPNASVLEIGCGWGALAERLIDNADSHVTGVTLSVEQLRYARSRLALAGHSAKSDMHLVDYRDLTGTFDGIVSIEMLEAVGESYWPVYFTKLRSLLRPGARAVVQVITINEDRFESYRARPDFIQRYIFPGGMLPTKSLMREHVARSGLRLVEHEFFAASYAATLSAWRSRFQAAWPQLQAMGYDENFRRVWDYYLAYCEAGFRLDALDVGIYVLE
jgi:cyclopropane-fatty-acyl-phospholipid synthase